MSDSVPLVSVVIPAYNAAATIGATLESALAQTHGALEVVVVDDGSCDDTAAIVAAVAERDGRVRLATQPNAGGPAARNHAVRLARGDLVAPLDADDLWHPEKIAEQVAALERAGPEVAAAYCWSWAVDEAGVLIPAGPYHAFRFERTPFAAAVTYGFIGNGSSMLIRKDHLEAVGGFDEDLRTFGEGMLCVKLAEKWNFVCVPRFLVGYRMLAGSLSHNPEKARQDHDEMIRRVRCAHPELPGWLFRIIEAKFRLYTAKRALRGPQWRRVLGNLAGAVLRDPLLPLALNLGGATRRLLGLPRRELRVPRVPFLPPDGTLDRLGEPPVTPLEARRRAAVAALSTDRCGRLSRTAG